MCRLIQATAPISTSSPTAMPNILTPMVSRIAPRTLIPALLFRLQGPGAVPVGARRMRPEMGNAGDEDPARPVFGIDCQAFAEAGLGLLPGLRPIGDERGLEGVAQFEPLRRD